MKIIDCDFPKDENPNQVSISLGNLDGLHLGHQKMIRESLKYCQKHPMMPSVLLFKDHTEKEISHKIKKQLTSLKDKIELLDKMGVEIVFLKSFDHDFMSMDKEVFVRDFLVKRLNTRHIVIGKDYSFGKMAEGRTKDLENWQEKYGYSFEQVPDVLFEGSRISSTRIRKEVRDGHIEKANEMLGYPYTIKGEVGGGAQRGRLLGYPTANLSLDFPYVVPKDGVYLTKTKVRGKSYYGMTDIGKNPTFGGDQVKIETHLFDFSGDIYGEKNTLSFLRYARGDVKFSSADELIKQLDRDNELLRKWAKEDKKKHKIGQEILSGSL